MPLWAAFIGFLTGHVTGNSRTAVVGDITPVLLAGVGGLFVLSLSHERINSFLAGIFVMAFGMTFFQGSVLGSYHRNLSVNLIATQAALSSKEGNSDTDEIVGVSWGMPLPPMGTVGLPGSNPLPTSPLPVMPTLPFTAMPAS